MKSSLIVDSASNNAIESLNAQGLPLPLDAELEKPSIPTDITTISDDDLMELYTKFVAYSDFVNTQLSCALIDEKDIERRIEFEEAKVFLELHSASKSSTVTLIKAQVDANEDIARLKSELMQKYAYRKLIETMANNYDRGSAVCSRELTRRTSNDNFKTRARKFQI
jgi:hypothetical protein